MNKKNITILVLLLTFLIATQTWSEVTLRIEYTIPCCFMPGSDDNSLDFTLDNPEDSVAAIQLDILFDTSCFTVTSVQKTDRTNEMDIFTYSVLETGIRIAMTGIDNHISPGTGSIATITMDVGDCVGDYIWDLHRPVVADPVGGEVNATVEDANICVANISPIYSASESQFNFGDVFVGQTKFDTLIISNTGCLAMDLILLTEDCAMVEPDRFPLLFCDSQTITVSCQPYEEGLCEGKILIEGGFGIGEITVTCNGVIPTGTKGDVNEDGEINVLDAVKAVNYMLGLILLTGPEAIWAADCNGSLGMCHGDQLVDILDVIKIVNLILGLDECLPDNVIYFNSFESAEDTTGWYGITEDMFVNDPAPQGGRKSLYIVGGCMQPQAFFQLPQQSEDGYYTLSCWGKDAGTWTGKIILACSTFSIFENEVELYIVDDSWTFYQSENSLFCPSDSTLKIGIEIGGDIPERMYIDCIKVEKVE